MKARYEPRVAARKPCLQCASPASEGDSPLSISSPLCEGSRKQLNEARGQQLRGAVPGTSHHSPGPKTDLNGAPEGLHAHDVWPAVRAGAAGCGQVLLSRCVCARGCWRLSSESRMQETCAGTRFKDETSAPSRRDIAASAVASSKLPWPRMRPLAWLDLWRAGNAPASRLCVREMRVAPLGCFSRLSRRLEASNACPSRPRHAICDAGLQNGAMRPARAWCPSS